MFEENRAESTVAWRMLNAAVVRRIFIPTLQLQQNARKQMLFQLRKKVLRNALSAGE
jgi:hypothetical protein